MQCETFEGRLHELLDERERPESDALLREHALVCSGCAEKLASQEALFAGLAKAEIPALSADFTQRVLANRRPELRHWFSRRFALSLLVLAAVLLVAALPAFWFFAGDGSSGQTGSESGGQNMPVAENQNPTLNRDRDLRSQDEPDPDLQDEAPDSVRPEEGESETGTMIATTGFPNVFRGLPSVHDLPWDVPPELLPEIDQQQAEAVREVWVNQVATPLKPVTNSVNGAFNVLRRTLAAGPDWQLESELEEEPQAGLMEIRGVSVISVS